MNANLDPTAVDERRRDLDAYDAYVLEGQSPSQSQLFDAAAEARGAAGADWFLALPIVTIDEEHVLHSATLVSAADPKIDAELVVAAHRLFPLKSARGHGALINALRYRDVAPLRNATSEQALELILSRHPSCKVVERRPGRNFGDFKFLFVFGGARATQDQLESVSHRVQRLLAISQPVQAAAQIAAAQAIDRGVETYEQSSTSSEGTDLASDLSALNSDVEQQIVALAADATQSDSVRVFDLQHGASGLELAERHPSNGNEPVALVGAAGGGQSPLQAAAIRRRPMILNSPDDYERLGISSADQPLMPTLIVPIPQPLGTSPEDSLGLLEVTRSSTQQLYRVVDLQLLRIAAFRLSQARLHRLLAEISKSLSNARGFASTAPLPGPETSALVPAQWSRQREPLTALLDEAQDVLGCLTISLRVLSTDGTALVRIAATPSGLSGDARTQLPLSSAPTDSCPLVARVCMTGITEATTGAEQGGVSSGGDPMQRHELVSSYCTPVFVHGRLCGSLNFDSRSRRVAPAAFRSVAELIAESCGQLLESSVAAQVLSAQQVAFRGAMRVHQIRKSLERVSESTTGIVASPSTGPSPADLDELRESSTRALLAIDPLLVPPDDVRKRWQRMPLERLIREAVDRAELDSRISLEQPQTQLKIASETARFVYGPLVELLLNAAAASQGCAGDVDITVGDPVMWSGRMCCPVTIANPTRGRLDSVIAESLYQAPIVPFDHPQRGASPSRRRVSWGAYLAAEQIRSIGGDVFVRHVTDNSVTTTLRVPTEQSPRGVS